MEENFVFVLFTHYIYLITLFTTATLTGYYCFVVLSKKQNKTKNTLTLIIKTLNFRSNNQFTHSLLFILYIHTYIHT